jgi:hypothetical protein
MKQFKVCSLCCRRGRYIIRTKWFRIYWNGSFSKLEIDLGRVGGWELACYFGTIQGAAKIRLNPSLKHLEYKISLMNPNQL